MLAKEREMAEGKTVSELVTFTKEQEKEGYWVEQVEDRVLVWHYNNQIALLYLSSDIGRKVQEVVEGRRKKLREVEEKTGWKPSPPAGWGEPN